MSLLSDKIEISKESLIHAQKLKNNNLQRRHLKEIITEIIKRISQELILAHREGKHDIITNVPTTYDIPNMSNSDSQRFIWASIIEELILKEYRVWISPGKDLCRMKITWMSPDDETEVKHQMNLIIKNTKNIL
jgi:hypothetical protein